MTPQEVLLIQMLIQAFALTSQILHEMHHVVQTRRNRNRTRRVLNTLPSIQTHPLRPGRGNPRIGFKKQYIRQRKESAFHAVSLYSFANLQDTAFSQATGKTTAEFELILSAAHTEVTKPMDPRLQYSTEGNTQRVPRKRLMSSNEMVFFWLRVMRAGNEGSLGTRTLQQMFGLSPGTISNYFYHVTNALFRGIWNVDEGSIRWPNASERRVMGKLLYGFDGCFALDDGTKQKIWRPRNRARQDAAYDGHHHTQCLAALVWVDPLGIFIRLDFSLRGSEHDRSIFRSSEPVRKKHEYFSEGDSVMADTGFVGPGPLVTPSKKGENLGFAYRAEMNKDIRRQRISNEWGVGAISNKWRIFLGRWPFLPELWPICYETAAMILNWFWRREGTLIPVQRRLERIEMHEMGHLDYSDRTENL